MLMKLEANLFYLENQLTNYMEANFPSMLDNTNQLLQHIRMLPIPERTLYISSVIRMISQHHLSNSPDFDKIHLLLQSNKNFDETTLKAFEKSMQRWVSEIGNEGN